MSDRFSQWARLAQRGPTLLRTARHLKPGQAAAQLRHALVGVHEPVTLTAPPPRLAIGTPATPFLAPPAHVRRPSAETIELLGRRLGFAPPPGDAPDWETREYGPLIAYHLHQHEFLRLDTFTPEERSAVLLDWIDRHPRGVGWDPHPISLRLRAWGKLLLTPGALVCSETERASLLRSMADQAETLSRGLEVRLQANHLLSNLAAVVFSGLLLEGPASAGWLGRSRGLVREIDAQIHADGGHEERSPMYHALLLEELLDVLGLVRARPQRAPLSLVRALEAASRRMLEALFFYCHPDGRIALFSDAGFDVAAEPAALEDYAARLGIERRRNATAAATPRRPEGAPSTADVAGIDSKVSGLALPDTGFVRLEAPRIVVLASVAGPSPPHQPGHAHCDALSFECSLGERRVVTDTGLFEYAPGVRREIARATASHSTIQLDGEEQAELWAAHRVGGRPVVACGPVRAEGARAVSVEASCRGWSRPASVHHRRFEVEAGHLRIFDRIEGPCERLRWPLPLDPDCEIELAADGRIARGRFRSVPGAAGFVIELPEPFEWRLERGPYYASFHREAERFVLVGECASGPLTASLVLRLEF